MRSDAVELPTKAPPSSLPLTIVTGFLGAGKTRLLNGLLRDPALANTLVIVNELGEVALDHLLIEQEIGDVLVMSSGCLCCSIRSDLMSTMEDLLRARDNARIAPFQRIIIETTGLADPVPVLHAVMAHPYLLLQFCLDGVITLIDAINGAATLDAYDEAVRQVALADRLVLSKTDLLEPECAAPRELRTRLKTLNPGAVLLDAAKGEATVAALLDSGPFDTKQKIPEVRRWLNAEAFVSTDTSTRHSHDDGATLNSLGQPEAARHDANIRTFCLRHKAPLMPSRLDLFLETLRKAHGPNLLRIKGIVALSDDVSRPAVIHGVQHVFHPPQRLSGWPDADQITRIVFILRQLDPAVITTMWQMIIGLVEPSGEACANPLAPSKGGFFL